MLVLVWDVAIWRELFFRLDVKGFFMTRNAEILDKLWIAGNIEAKAHSRQTALFAVA